MAVGDQLLKEKALIGLAVGVGIGFGLAVFAPSLFPQVSRAARPVAKRMIKSAVRAYARGREGLAEFSEFTEDVIAEAKEEVIEERRATAAARFEEAAKEAE